MLLKWGKAKVETLMTRSLRVHIEHRSHRLNRFYYLFVMGVVSKRSPRSRGLGFSGSCEL